MNNNIEYTQYHSTMHHYKKNLQGYTTFGMPKVAFLSGCHCLLVLLLLLLLFFSPNALAL